MATSKEIKELRENLIEEAKQFGSWAGSQNLLRLGQPIVELERREDFPAMFSGEGRSAFRKPITAIGINPYKNFEKGGTMFVYTQAILARRDQEAIAETYQGKSHLEFKVLKSFKAAPGTSSIGGVQRPRRINGYIPCGSSISLAVMRDAGTLGALVRVKNELYGLSANHVTGGCSNAPFGSPILFPGILDVAPGVEDPLTIGHHHLGLEMSHGNPNPQISAHQNLDAAIFSIRDPGTITSLQGDFYDTPNQVEKDLELLEDLDVEKVGRTTGHTKGFIESLIVGYQPLSYKLKIFVSSSEQIPFEGIVYYWPTYLIRAEEGRRFAEEGDSGAIVVSRLTDDNQTRKAVGLLIGGEADGALMLPLDPILKKFDAELVSGYNTGGVP